MRTPAQVLFPQMCLSFSPVSAIEKTEAPGCFDSVFLPRVTLLLPLCHWDQGLSL